MYYLLFCIGAILLMSALIGLKRGIFKTLFGFVALILTVAVTYFASPYITTFIMDNTQIDERIEDKIYKKIETDTQKTVAESLKNAGVTTDLNELTKKETKYILENDPDKETQIKQIDALNLPDYVKGAFIQNNTDNMYEKLGVTNFYKYISRYAARLIVNVIAIFGTFVVLRVILIIIAFIINRSMDEDPVLSGINRFLGMLLGLAVGVVIVWGFMIIASIAFGSQYDSMIAGNEILQKINDTNLLVKVITSITS